MFVESLEARQLLAAAAMSSITINGTAGNDTITITQSGNIITINKNGVISTHKKSYLTGGTTPSNPLTQAFLGWININGLGGNDTITANNTVLVRMEIQGGAGSDTVRGGAYADRLYGGVKNSAYSESGYDKVYGGNGDDELFANKTYACQLYGEGGKDTLTGSANNDTLDGGTENDLLNGNAGADLLRGGYGNDIINGGGNNDTCYGGYGNDSINGESGNDYMYGDANNDVIEGGDGLNTYWGGTGDDWLEGGQHNEVFWGEAGNDTILGNAGLDRINGGDNDDWLDGGIGGIGDVLFGGAGIDTADYSKPSSPLSISLDGLANDGINGEKDNVHYDVENVIGGKGNDTIIGSSYANRLEGGYGDDLIKGGQGNDVILGGSGEDALHGNYGDDQIFGEGSDDQLYAGDGNDYLDGGWGKDYLIAVGGGGADQLRGGSDSDFDSFWMDKTDTENHNATQSEIDNRCVHRIESFENGASKELLGQSFSDPIVDDSELYFYWSGQDLSANPLFSDQGAQKSDVNQGKLGDCWFLSTLSSIAQMRPNYIHQSIADLGDGTYAVMFYEDGEKMFYRVDADLPAERADNSIAYAGLGWQSSMWVAIMEKAYAMHEGEGFYEDIAGGWSEDAFEDMGMDSEEIDVDDDDAMATIKGHLAAGRPVTISSVAGDFQNGDSYVMSHQYSVIAVFDDGTILLRNPWATDAGGVMGSFVQGADDGYVVFTQSSIIDMSEDFTVGFW